MEKIDGFRSNVGVIVLNPEDQTVLVGKRNKSNNYWQFPQGGIDEGETETEAMYRELHEETGLEKKEVSVIAKSSKTFTYLTPKNYRKYPEVIGQQQRWFLLSLLRFISPGPVHNNDEFVEWRYINFFDSPELVIPFKKNLYTDVVSEFRKWF